MKKAGMHDRAQQLLYNDSVSKVRTVRVMQKPGLRAGTKQFSGIKRKELA